MEKRKFSELSRAMRLDADDGMSCARAFADLSMRHDVRANSVKNFTEDPGRALPAKAR